MLFWRTHCVVNGIWIWGIIYSFRCFSFGYSEVAKQYPLVARAQSLVDLIVVPFFILFHFLRVYFVLYFSISCEFILFCIFVVPVSLFYFISLQLVYFPEFWFRILISVIHNYVNWLHLCILWIELVIN